MATSYQPICPVLALQGGLDPNKISDLGADFGIIVRSLLELNKSGALKPSLIMS